MKPTQQAIEELRSHLEVTVKRTGYDFLHPEVVKMSQRLDELIVAHMRCISKRL